MKSRARLVVFGRPYLSIGGAAVMRRTLRDEFGGLRERKNSRLASRKSTERLILSRQLMSVLDFARAIWTIPYDAGCSKPIAPL
jgi:hypothetical protein